MNKIAKDFLKEINSHIIVEGDDITVNQVSLAESLAGKVERFITWLVQNCEPLYDFNSKSELVFMLGHRVDDIAYFYQYWLENIDNK